MSPTYKKSKSGYYKVELLKVFTHQGFDYKPSHDITVNEDLLNAMIDDGAVKSIVSAV